MVQTTRLIKALEKAGYEVKMTQSAIYDHDSGGYVLSSKSYFCDSENRNLTWHDQNGYVVCLHAKHKSQIADSQSDYFPGYFVDTIKQAINSLKEG